MQFDNTRIYQKALELVSLSQRLLNELPLGYGFLGDQLKRAACSVPLNFAEGYAKGVTQRAAAILPHRPGLGMRGCSNLRCCLHHGGYASCRA